MRSSEPSIGDIFSAEVRDLTSEGSGVVSHPTGRTFFVDGVWPGETGQFQVRSLKGRIGFAELKSLELKSPFRIEAPCPFQGYSTNHCGGCPWQYIEYSAQLEAKQNRIEKELVRAGVHEPVTNIWPSEKIYGYRNRTQLKTDGEVIGYVSANTNNIVPVDDCLILTDKNRQTLKALVQQLPNINLKPANNQNWNSIDIDETVDEASLSVNKRLPFKQANTEQNEKMKAWLAKKFETLPVELNVIELFCGSGNFTEVIANRGFNKILAVDAVGEAIDALKLRKLNNVSTMSCNLFDELGLQRVYQHGKDAQVLVIDPPREGMKIKKALFPGGSKIKHIFYVSCDLATFVRDIKDFSLYGFSVKEIQPLDQFPHTPHVELLAYLSI